MPDDVGQGVVISTIWAIDIAAETKHSRRQFQEKNCRCAGPWKTDWWKIPRQSCLLSKTWNKPQRCDLWGSGIHHTNCSPVIKIRNATVWGRYHSYKTTRGRRTFIQRQSQSTVMGEEKIAAELMNVEYSKGKTTSGILMWKQSLQSRSSLSKGCMSSVQLQKFLACNFIGAKDNSKSSWWNSVAVTRKFKWHLRL